MKEWFDLFKRLVISFESISSSLYTIARVTEEKRLYEKSKESNRY